MQTADEGWSSSWGVGRNANNSSLKNHEFERIFEYKLRWAGHVARMEQRRDKYKVLVGNLSEGDHLEDPGVDRRIILKWIFDKWDERHGLNRSVSGQGQVGCCCDCGNEPLSSIKCREFCD